MNLSGQRLCFHPPAHEYEDPVVGSVTTTHVAPDGEKHGIYIEHYDGRWTRPREKLLLEIRQSWVKLAPNEVYVTDLADIHVDLDMPGRWRLDTTFYPIESPFGSQAEFREYVESAAETFGCAVPKSKAEADPIFINVIAPEKKK